MSGLLGVKRSSIDVFIRVRPIRVELHETSAAWDISATTLREKGNPDNLFTFDHVYNTTDTTQELYERSVRSSIVANVAKGYNGTVFAYGQTGSGKSYTMLGDDGSSRASNKINAPEGVVEMSVRDLFADLEKEQQKNPSMQVAVYVTMIEIYNEQMRDLLLVPGAVAAPLSIRENEHGVYVHNAIRREVTSARACFQLIQTQAEGRVSASTVMNEHSSRSHCVIRILVEKTIPLEEDSDVSSGSEEEEDEELCGMKKKVVATLNLVDLAGSERVAKTGSTGIRRVEGGHINKSLTILATVISRLTECVNNVRSSSNNSNNNTNNTASGGTTAFVPYRDSRLTHLLKTAIGGNSLTAVFCCITPAVQNVDESRSTLQFAARVKAIKNKVSVNEIADPKTRLREAEIDLRRYKRMMVATTIYLWSKSVRIKHLEQKMDELLLSGVARTPTTVTTAADTAGSDGVSHTTPSEQQRIIIERLTEQNEELLQELSKARDALKQQSEVAGNTYSGTAAAAAMVLADDEEKHQLRADVRDLEQMLKEVLDEKSAIQQSMDELDSFCKELEDENAVHASSLKKLQTTCKELQALVDAKDAAEGAAKEESHLLKEQLAKTQSKLLEKGRYDDYLQQLTKLHIEHQELQFSHHQLQEKHNRELGEERAQIEGLQSKIEELEDEAAELRDANKLQNSYLWRLLGVASVVSHGKALNPEEATTTVRGAQVDAAVKTLTTVVLASLERPPGVLESAEVNHQVPQPSTSRKEINDNGSGNINSDGNNGGGDAALQKRIEELQQQLIARDAQRDVIIDSKLKRMQNLALRLHTTNAALVEELRQSFALSEELFRFVDKHPKLAPKLAKAGLVPTSFKTAVERAMLAKVPMKQYGHN
ncbi:kinesin [Trypanosoma grayi]|uniref:kinesin n=1 Tax=Trypanosoma grayi TaxID=71804 RepID=UPI0004F495E2|nr:kinesin [Trypanosoma grayi]KEG10472.1 kinesin [Trypanosoma grayi]